MEPKIGVDDVERHSSMHKNEIQDVSLHLIKALVDVRSSTSDNSALDLAGFGVQGGLIPRIFGAEAGDAGKKAIQFPLVDPSLEIA